MIDAEHAALIKRARAKAELELREEFDTLETYIPRANPKHTCTKRMAPLYRALDRFQAGETVNLLGAAPPRSRKSTTKFHAIVRKLQTDPSFQFIYGTYNTQFAREQSTICRAMAARAGLWISDEREEERDPAAMFDKASSTVYWQTARGGGGKFLGRGGAAIGSGAKLVDIDDPIKGEAESEPDAAANEQTWRWIVGPMFTRADPGASKWVFHHRWSDDDPIGRLMNRSSAARAELSPEQLKLIEDIEFEYFEFPAVYGKGDPAVDPLLIPEKDGGYKRSELVLIKATDDRVWEAMYQQKPHRRGAKLFPVEYPQWIEARDIDGEIRGMTGPVTDEEDDGDAWFPVPDLTGKLLVIGADTAGTEGGDKDWTAVTLYAYSWSWADRMNAYLPIAELLRAWFERKESPDVVEFVARIALAFDGVTVAFEDKAEGRAQLRFLVRQYPEIPVFPMKTDQSKRARVAPLAGAARNGRLRLPPPWARRTRWFAEWKRQHDAFTGYDNRVPDDGPDAGAHAYNYAMMHGPPSTGLVGGAEIGGSWRRPARDDEREDARNRR